ncbi:MAG: heat-inducible transcriptional repressor HrcA [Firmicutes bacterium]|nr:heat-inducible transcriptional repressor HrcA [Bacillota bacterium]
MDSRKEQILKAIIKEYIFGAEPVSSKTIVNRYGLNVSSATIRNEMAALESLGYIKQPHISSGRIPAASGYRYYVDFLMDNDRIADEYNILDINTSNIKNIHNYLKEIAILLAGLSNYTVIITEEKQGEDKIHHLKLVGLLEDKALLVLVLSSQKVKDYVLSFLERISEDELKKLTDILNYYLIDKNIDEITQELKQEIINIFPSNPLLVEEIFKLVVNALYEENNVDVIVEGVKNIFKFPEFNEVKKIESFINTLEDQGQLTRIFDNILGQEKGEIDIKIGDEIGLEGLSDFTVIATNCLFCDGIQGKIGIIGPTRMFYEKNITLLESLFKQKEE